MDQTAVDINWKTEAMTAYQRDDRTAAIAAALIHLCNLAENHLR